MEHARLLQVPRVASTLAIGLLVTVWTSPAPAAQKRRACGEVCEPAIQVCVQQGYRRHFCAKEVHALCRRTPTTCEATQTPHACLGAAACNVTPSGIKDTIESADALRRQLLGVWYDCKQPGTFGADAAGIEFTADGNWYFLALDGAALVRKSGFGQGGTYDIIDTSIENGAGHFQLNLNVNTGGGGFVTSWSLADQPHLLLITAGMTQTLYAHLPGAPACSTCSAP
jgi:hypothetical protein